MTKRTIDLGKIAYTGTRKINRVEINVTLDAGKLSIRGAIWNGRGTDWASGDRNLDEIGKLFPRDAKVQRIVAIWRDWHLNDMRAGTPRQTAYLKSLGEYQSYEWACTELKAANLYEDDGHKYGHAWLFEPLPAAVVSEIESWFA